MSDQSPLRWSVLIPVYEPGPYLEQTLQSVLSQDPGADRMQIEVIDDASPTDRVEAIVRTIAGNRVGYFRQPVNVGLARNWNTCMSHAHGEFVHILHQDDLVEPGFYSTLAAGLLAEPRAGMAFCRHRIIDSEGLQLKVSDEERPTPGIISGWAERLAVKQRIHCPSVVMRRSIFDAIGGFRTDLRYLLDWEMWVRIAARYPVWFEPKVLASYRTHVGSETARLVKARVVDDDYFKVYHILGRHFAPTVAREIVPQTRIERALDVTREADWRLQLRQPLSSIERAIMALRHSSNPTVWLSLGRIGWKCAQRVVRKVWKSLARK